MGLWFPNVRAPMKKSTSKITLILSVLALAGAFIVPVAKAQDDKAAKKAKREAEMLKKYDANKNGKLDDDEKAKMEADMKAAKEKKAKEKGNE